MDINYDGASKILSNMRSIVCGQNTMDKEKAISIIEGEIDIDNQTERLKTALYMAIDALRGIHIREAYGESPLTLGQLMGMLDKVVFVDVVKQEFSRLCDLKSQYGIVKPDESCVRLFNGRSVYFASYGAWVAYLYKPAIIDRNTWEACDTCSPSCKTCANYNGWDTYGAPNICKICDDYSNYTPDDNFCQNCGRPLTERAWAQLEKRVSEMMM